MEIRAWHTTQLSTNYLCHVNNAYSDTTESPGPFLFCCGLTLCGNLDKQLQHLTLDGELAWAWQCVISWLYTCITQWGWVTHICVSNLTIICSDNDLSPGRRLAIFWTNADFLNWSLENKLQSNLNRNSNIFNEENTFEKCRMRNVVHLVSDSMY